MNDGAAGRARCSGATRTSTENAARLAGNLVCLVCLVEFRRIEFATAQSFVRLFKVASWSFRSLDVRDDESSRRQSRFSQRVPPWWLFVEKRPRDELRIANVQSGPRPRVRRVLSVVAVLLCEARPALDALVVTTTTSPQSLSRRAPRRPFGASRPPNDAHRGARTSRTNALSRVKPRAFCCPLSVAVLPRPPLALVDTGNSAVKRLS